MQASYGPIARRSAVFAAAAGAIMLVLSGILGGAKGLVGAALGVALVAVFFALSVLAVGRAARGSPQAMMVAPLTSFFVKIIVLLFLVARFATRSACNGRRSGLAAIVCTLVWSGA